MKFLITGRQEGKTTKLLEWAASAPKPCAIAVINNTEANRLEKVLQLRGIKKVHILSFERMLQPDGLRYKAVFIDNVDHWIMNMVWKRLEQGAEVTATATGELVPHQFQVSPQDQAAMSRVLSEQ